MKKDQADMGMIDRIPMVEKIHVGKAPGQDRLLLSLDLDGGLKARRCFIMPEVAKKLVQDLRYKLTE